MQSLREGGPLYSPLTHAIHHCYVIIVGYEMKLFNGAMIYIHELLSTTTVNV